MIEIQLNTHTIQKHIVNFHANALTFYYATGTQPYVFHVGHIQSIEIVEKKGRYYLSVSTGFTENSEEFDAELLPKVQELVSAVQKAMKEFQTSQ